MKVSEFLEKQNNNLDLIRIILASLVIIGHTPILNGYTAYWADPIGYFFPFTYAGSLAVKAFFFISGLVVTHSYLKRRDALYFIISRIFRVIPALLFVLIATVFVVGPVITTLSIGNYFANPNNLSYIYNNLIFQTAYYLPGMFASNPYPHAVNGSLWSLKYEMGCYAFLLVTFLLMGKAGKKYYNIPIAFVIADALLDQPILFAFLGPNIDISLLPMSFALGCLLAVNADFIPINLYPVLIAVIFLIIFRNNPYNQILLLLTFCMAIIYISSRKTVVKLKPKYDISYGVYLWGFLVQQSLFYYLGTLYAGLHCIIALGLSITLAMITYFLIELPFMDLGKRIFKSLKNKNAVLSSERHFL